MKKLREGQVWELKSGSGDAFVVMLLRRDRSLEGEIIWHTLVLHDTLYPNDVGTATMWLERELLDEWYDDEGVFMRIT